MTITSTTFFSLAFLAMCAQMLIAYVQAKDFKKTLGSMKKGGITGVGHTKGVIRPGQIIILHFDKVNGVIDQCRIMRGLTIFARFKEDNSYDGMTLDEVRELGIELDAKAFKRRRKKHPYDPEELTKKKHALIQAVEAIDRRIEQDAHSEGKRSIPKVHRPSRNVETA